MGYGTVVGRNPDNPDRQAWRTKPEVFRSLHEIFGFTVDAAADKDNALLPVYWSEENSALEQDWSDHQVFCNPPFGMNAKFLAKAVTARSAVFLLPITAAATRYFDQFRARYILIPPYRMPFIPPPGLKLKGKTPSPSLATLVLLYGRIQGWQLAACKETFGWMQYSLFN